MTKLIYVLAGDAAVLIQDVNITSLPPLAELMATARQKGVPIFV